MKKKTKWKKESVLGMIFILIPLIGYVIFNGSNLIISFIVQFFAMEPGDYMMETLKWNNFENFVEVFTDDRFWRAFRQTLMYASTRFVTLAISIIIAVLLAQKVKGSKVFEIIFFVPYVCSTVAVAIMWKWIFEEAGIINTLFGLDISWLNNSEYLPWVIIIATIWRIPGYSIIVYKAALTSINKSLYEAYSLDGGNWWQTFWHITFPSILPTTLYLLMTGFIAGMGTFEIPRMIGGYNATSQIAGAGDSALTSMFYIFITGRMNDQMNIASVMSWFMFIVQFVISMFLYRAKERSEA